MRRMKGSLCALVLVLTLPTGALAVTEGVVEEAPGVAIELGAATEAAVLPDEQLYDALDYRPPWSDSLEYVKPEKDDQSYYAPMMRFPQLTAGEAERAKVLLKSYEAGERTGDGASVLGKTECVTVGVYPLDPGAFDGETAYVILPGTCLRDEDILSLIDAFAQLGQRFDPHGLNARNCMRGGYLDESRPYIQDELTRMERLRGAIQRGELDEVGNASVTVTLNPLHFGGKKTFTLLPYRELTDAQLAANLLAQGERSLTENVDFARLESRAREAMDIWLGCAPDMTLLSTDADMTYIPATLDAQGRASYTERARSGVQLTFGRENKQMKISYTAQVLFDAETGELMRMRKDIEWRDAETQEFRSDGYMTRDADGLRYAQYAAEGMPGCEGVEVTLSPGSDETHVRAQGMMGGGWRCETAIERSSGNVVTHEYLRGLNAVSLDEMNGWYGAAVDAIERAQGLMEQNPFLRRMELDEAQARVTLSCYVFGEEEPQKHRVTVSFERTTGQLVGMDDRMVGWTE
ncbi:MAG: hypothetical protein ACI4O4_05625 [Candidatus Ventricola sp.]